MTTATTSNSQQSIKLRPAPTQERCSEAIFKMEKELSGLIIVQNSGLVTPEILQCIRKLEKDLQREKAQLKRLKGSALRS